MSTPDLKNKEKKLLAGQKAKNKIDTQKRVSFGTAEGIRTPDLLVRSQTLYPTELQPHTAGEVSLTDSL